MVNEHGDAPTVASFECGESSSTGTGGFCSVVGRYCCLITAVCGFAIICLAYVISFRSQSIEPPGLYGLGLFVIALVPFLALLAVGLDLANRKRYDIFHWFGVAAFLGVLGHFLALIGVAQL